MAAPENNLDPRDQPNFDRAIEVQGGSGKYEAVVYPEWDGPLSTHGGLLSALILGAVDREIDDDQMQVRAITCHYLRPPAHGVVEIDVKILRRGRRLASSRAELGHDGKTCITALLMHSTRELPEVTDWSIDPPRAGKPPTRDLPSLAPEQIAAGERGWLEMPQGAPAFFSRLLFAPRFGSTPFAGPPPDPKTGTENGGWMMTRNPRTIDVAYLAFLVDSFWPSVFQSLRTPAMAPTLDLTTHFRSVLPEGGLPDQPLLVHNTAIAVEDGIADSDSRIFTVDGMLLAQARQLQMLAPLETF